MDGLEYIVDGRNTEPNVDGYRKGRFKACWKDAAERNKKYDAGTLETLYWQHLGYRLGKLLGKATEEIQEEMYANCVKQQEQKERINSEPTNPEVAI